MNNITRLLLSLFLIIFLFFPTNYVKASNTNTKVVIVDGINSIGQKMVSKILTQILNGANDISDGNKDIEQLKEYCTEQGFESLSALIKKTGFFTTIAEYRTRVIETSSGDYEVRGIKVKVKLGDTTGDPFEELVFVLNFRLFIDDVHFAMESHHYERLVSEGHKLDDMIYRQKIIGFIEDFRTAHNRKNVEYIEKAYSDDALIIVGRVLKEQEGQSDFFESSTLGDQKIQFIKLKKKEYIQRLTNAFKYNSFVRVIFDNIEIIKHSKYPDIYGVQLEQRWNSSNYSDEGFLFIMIDFKNPENPLIHVRAWQPEKFADGSVVGLGDFEIIE